MTPEPEIGSRTLAKEDYRQQAEFRHHLKRFLKAAEQNAKAAGLDASQYQLLLIVKGMPDGVYPHITMLAKRLLVEAHSAVELADRLHRKGLVERFREGSDRRLVFVRLTEEGDALVSRVAHQNRVELSRVLPDLLRFLGRLEGRETKAGH